MTSIQLPPLTFDEGGFRVSVIANGPSRDSTNGIPSSHTQSQRNTIPEVPEPDDDDSAAMQQLNQAPDDPPIPEHPIPSMQDAFAESLLESTQGGSDEAKPKLRGDDALYPLDAQKRHELLMGEENKGFKDAERWRWRKGQEQHEVLKLVSQIAFGVYLLLNGMANDNNQVINILQGHIDEVDEFLEVTLEDLSYSITDLESRIDHLRVPLANLQVFEEMLESRSYRVELLEGNEKLEHIIARSSAMIELWNKDVIAGKDCTESFTEWLSSLKESIWKNDNEDIVDIFHAMRGNGDGWLSAFIEMGSRVEDINKRVAELSGLTAEMEKKAGEVSRKTWSAIPPFSSPVATSPVTSIPSLKDRSSMSLVPSIISIPKSARRASIKSGSGSGPIFRATSVEEEVRDEVQIELKVEMKEEVKDEVKVEVKLEIQDEVKAEMKKDGVPQKIEEEEEEEDDDDIDFDDGLSNFPVPGALPLLPPMMISKATPKKPPINPPTLHMDTESKFIVLDATIMDEKLPVESESQPEPETEELYLLQPRTYTPQPPEPLPSPMVRDIVRDNPPSPSDGSSDSGSPLQFGMPFLPVRSSLRNSEASVNTSRDRRPHDSYGSANGRPSMPHDSYGSANGRPSIPTPRNLDVSGRGSASSAEADAYRQHYLTRIGSQTELRPQVVQARSSELRQYHPVLASPHSPLQQRPHTAAGPPGGHPQTFRRPSDSMPPPIRPNAARVTTMSSAPGHYGDRGNYHDSGHYGGSQYGAPSMRTVTHSTRTTRTTTNQTLKKKKSAFGWLKKAFTMDDEERAAFEARKTVQYSENYYKDKNPKFLDGKRMR
ncbi:unnamed protein product [Clonostachys rosea f. rosea IK726]|uniref:Uncharacterized protein n=2 Tax=Bionectria ochroleuca TaxID=29856 RepID=A0A0B7JMY1_BIOOC|nr:unnamed protein product [Clonostachys rosea f. rosea IK726]